MRRWLIFSLLLVVLLALLAGCGGSGDSASGVGESGEGRGGAVGQAEAASCAANLRTIMGAVQQYQATEGTYPRSIQELVPEYLMSVPTCPSGGKYTLSGSTVTCSVHGSL